MRVDQLVQPCHVDCIVWAGCILTNVSVVQESFLDLVVLWNWAKGAYWHTVQLGKSGLVAHIVGKGPYILEPMLEHSLAPTESMC